MSDTEEKRALRRLLSVLPIDARMCVEPLRSALYEAFAAADMEVFRFDTVADKNGGQKTSSFASNVLAKEMAVF